MIPKRIGRYDIEKLLGQGGQGTVLLARDSELGRQVAIKLLRPDPQVGGTLAREARIVSRLQHPNVVTLYDVGTHGQLTYLVLEYIDGESLDARIRREGKLSLRDSVILTSQVLSGVAYLHENGVVHRDLSPANILITREGLPKVTDFGLSVLHHGADPTGEVAGTLRYMAPEAFRNEQSLGPAADVFSMGSVLFEMLTGKRLFDGQTAIEVVGAIVNGGPVEASAHGLALDAPLASVLRTASQRDLHQRFADARAMKRALDAYRLPRDDGEVEASAPHGTVEYLLRRIQRKKGFSSLSAHIGEVLKLTSDESGASAAQLVNVLAKDMTLSQRVLSRANSAMYGRTEVTDLPGAVRLLGLDQVRVCVTSALLEKEFELGSIALRESMLSTFHCAALAKCLAGAFGIRSAADAFTAGMFHHLGRTLVIHYMADDHDDIVERARRLHSDELTESREVLGIAYHELGMAVGAQWQLPDTVVESMRPLSRGPVAPAENTAQRLRACVAFSAAVGDTLVTHVEPEECASALAELVQRVGAVCADAAGPLMPALAEAATLTAQYARIVELDPASNVHAGGLGVHRPLPPLA